MSIDWLMWSVGTLVLVSLLALALYKEQPVRASRELAVGMIAPVVGLVFTSFEILDKPIFVLQGLTIVCAVFLVLGRGRPLTLVPPYLVTGLATDAERVKHARTANRRQNEVLGLSLIAVAASVVYVFMS